MNKKFFVSWLVVFVVWMAGSFFVHGLLLKDEYATLPNLYRTETETQELFPLMLLAHVVMAGAFVWIYQRGQEAKPWLAQGLRFGVAIALLVTIPLYVIYYVVQPLPVDLVIGQIVYDTILVLILGIVAAFLSKPAQAAGR